MDNYNKKEMLKIGDVAKLNQVSIDTLRYYDRIGLFPADWVDDNGYRYYQPKSMVNLDTIMWFRSMGAGLAEVRAVLEDMSLKHTQAILANREKELVEEIKKMQVQLQLCRMYSGYMKLAQDYLDSVGYVLPFAKRWCVHCDTPIPMDDKDAFEMSMKTLFSQYTDKFYYYNTLFGGIFRGDGAGGEVQMYPAIYNFDEVDNLKTFCMDEGFYAVLPVYGYIDTACKKIPKLLEFVRKNHYRPVSDCYVVKIWEVGEQDVEDVEIMELQVRVEKE